MSPSPIRRELDQSSKARVANDLALVLLYVRAFYQQWPSEKSELQKLIADLRIDELQSEMIKRIWQSIAHEINNEEIVKMCSQSTNDWNKRYKHHLLTRLSQIYSKSNSLSQDFLGQFLKDFVVSKFRANVHSVFDPAFGIGNILFTGLDGSFPRSEIDIDEDGNEFEAISVVARRLEGNELNVGVCNLAMTLGTLCGYDTNILAKDSLALGGAESSQHQLVVCEPPVGQKLSSELIKQEWRFGPPLSGRTDWAWAQVVYNHLTPNGYGLLFIPRGSLFRTNESLIRAKMINSGAIRAIFNLPPGSHSSSRIPMSLLILAGEEVRNKRNDKILFLSLPEPKGRLGSPDHWTGIVKSIHDACQTFYRFEDGEFERVIGYSSSLDRNDETLVNSSWNLDPSNHVTQVATGIDVKLNVRKNMNQIAKLGLDLSNLIQATSDKFSTFAVRAEFTTVGAMIQTGKIVHVPGMSKNDMKKEVNLGEHGDPYLTVQDLRRNTPLEATGRVAFTSVLNERQQIRTEKDDVVLIKTGTPAARVDYFGGSLLFSPLSVLRLTDSGKKVTTPKILAFILNGDGIKKFMHGDSVGRLAVEKVPVPILESMNREEINSHLLEIEKLILKSNLLSEQLLTLDQLLSQVLWGEFSGLEESK